MGPAVIRGRLSFVSPLVFSSDFVVLCRYLSYSCPCLILSCLLFVSSWGSCGVIFCRLGGRFGTLGWSWSALRRSWRLLERSWGELTLRSVVDPISPLSWVSFWTHLGRPKGAKTEPKTRPGGLKRTQEAAKTAHKTTNIDRRIVFKNDPVLERS